MNTNITYCRNGRGGHDPSLGELHFSGAPSHVKPGEGYRRRKDLTSRKETSPPNEPIGADTLCEFTKNVLGNLGTQDI